MQTHRPVLSNKPKIITYQFLEEFLVRENKDLNRKTSTWLNNRDEAEQIVDMEAARFIFFCCISYKKYNYPSLRVGLDPNQKQMIDRMNMYNHSDHLLKLFDCYPLLINSPRIKSKAKVSQITELTIRLLFAALHPEHNNNKPDGINNLRCRYLAKEIDPPTRSIWHSQIKSSALILLTAQIFEHYKCVRIQENSDGFLCTYR